MSKPLFKLFGSINKIEDQEDGSIKVYGIASSESRDAAKEIIRADAMAAALPEYSKFPALREMHQPMAAGKVLEADVNADGITEIVAHVVDPIAITKVKADVYKGFSIGGKVLARDPKDRSIITELKLVEISLVDSPCNPDAQLTMWKADLMPEFKPSSADVIARAKSLAKAAGTQRFKDFLFEAGQELVSEHLLEKGEILEPEAEIEAPAEAPPAAEIPAAPEAPAAEAPDAPGVSAEAPAGEAPKEAGAEAAPIAGEPDEGEHGGEGAGENDEPEAKTAANPAQALADAISHGQAAIDAVAPPEPEAPADPFADLGKAAAALKGISLGESEAEGPLAKSLWHVGRLAELLSSVACLQECVAYEAKSEGDGSPIPAKLAEEIKNLGGILTAMAQEEVAELVASLPGGEAVEPEVVVIYTGEEILLAEQIVDLVKANGEIMDAASERLAKGAPEPSEIEAAQARIAELEGDLEKANQALAEAAPQVEDLSKRFGDTIDGLKSEIADLTQKFAALDQTPLPPKTAGPGRVVAKSQDSLGAGAEDPAGELGGLSPEQFEKGWNGLSEAERGQILLKAALRNPQLIAQR
jgi:phage head maturation protease